MSALLLPTWEELAESRPVLVTTMRRYLQQMACSLRPRSVGGVDLALRSFVAFLLETQPDVVSIASVRRRHIEDYKPRLAARKLSNCTTRPCPPQEAVLPQKKCCRAGTLASEKLLPNEREAGNRTAADAEIPA